MVRLPFLRSGPALSRALIPVYYMFALLSIAEMLSFEINVHCQLLDCLLTGIPRIYHCCDIGHLVESTTS